jgi:uncharacterized phiE125 gp8 family phage protein
VALTLVTPPSGELIPASELVEWVRGIEGNPQHVAELARLIKAAETSFQEHTGRQLRAATYKLTRYAFPRGRLSGFRLLKPPTRSVTLVRYVDQNGDWQTLDAAGYQTRTSDADGIFTEIWPAPLQFWPITEFGRFDAVEVTFAAGMYAAGERPDEEILRRLKAYVAFFMEHRDQDNPEGAADWIANLWLPWDSGEVL